MLFLLGFVWFGLFVWFSAAAGDVSRRSAAPRKNPAGKARM
jgi:hypothetical protein